MEENLEYNLDKELLDFYIKCHETYYQDSEQVYDTNTLLPIN